jgi:transcriptional regulator with XRE-family HTH domain
MYPEIRSIAARFKQFRESAGLSHAQVAAGVGMEIGASAVWDIESYEDDFSSCYTPVEVRRFCNLFGITPTELFGVTTTEAPISAQELVVLIKAECARRGVTLEQFEGAVGWHLAGFMDAPEALLEDMSVEGLQWLCREIGVDWHRVIRGL